MKATDMLKLASIAVDLDGTLAVHDSGQKFDPEHIGPPVPRMLERVKRWIAEGKEVKIFTARASDQKNIPPIRRWLKEHGISDCEITHQKTPDIERFYDDRAVKVYKNKGRVKPASTYFDVTRALEHRISGWSGHGQRDPL